MSLRSIRTAGRSLAGAAALMLAACGAEQTVSGAPSDDTERLSCDADRSSIVELLGSGLPAYDYEPAADLEVLVQRANAVVAGTITFISREVGEPDPDTGDNSWTVVSVASPQVLHGPDNLASIENFSFFTGQPNDDPLAGGVGVEGMRFVAFLNIWEPAPGGLVADVQGLVVDCGGETAATPIIEPLPRDVARASVADLITTIEDSIS